KNSYSIAIDRTPAALGVEKLDAASLSSWVYIFPTKNEVNGAFVMSVNNKMGVNVFWKGIFVSGTELPMGKWFKISGLFDLSEIKWTPEDKIQVYFWNNSSCDILVDDYYIVFGAGKERRGDSAMVDMTKGQPFQPKFNTPPYPFIYLEATDIHNENSIFLVNDGKTKEGRIGTTDHVYAGKFSGAKDGLDDLLVTRANGSKECFHFSKGKGAFEKVQILGAIPLEVEKTGVIMIEKSRVASYLVKQFEPASKQFKQLFAGKSIGRDTLKPSDQIFAGFNDAAGRSHTFRYNRDWRFDLKEIQFSDTTFRIISNVDFKGYEEDHNPKYYEKLMMVPGKFFSPGVTSFCVVAGNLKKWKGNAKTSTEWANLQGLPDKVQFYNYPVNGK
ncbi:MAG: hypothetical protein WCL00_13720, partial [Bacteroidota bacterium]